MLRDTLQALVGPVVEGLGYELWELEYAPDRGNGCLRLYIDAAAGITLEDCERVSRAVSELLDTEDPIPGHYTLEVSSPGLDRPLRTAAQFGRYVGEQVFAEVLQPIDGRRRYQGPLVAAGPETIEIEVDGRRCVLPLSAIRKAHLAPDT
ncbi:MAG: ribosome maturation factor RimP [Steroidobacteraceae bacterium]